MKRVRSILLIGHPGALGTPAIDVLARCPGDVERIAGILSVQRQHQFLRGRALLWRGVEAFFGPAASGWHLEAKVDLPPRLIDPSGASDPPSISISHSQEWTVCAFAQGARIGVDCEGFRRRSWEDIAAATLHADEISMWRQERLGKRDIWCLERWTVKEALLKACGLGVWQPAPAMINLSSDFRVLAKPNEVPGSPEDWCLGASWINETVCIAVALLPDRDRCGSAVEVWMLKGGTERETYSSNLVVKGGLHWQQPQAMAWTNFVGRK